MILSTNSPQKVLLLSICLIFSFSCSKDSDLLSDYVLSDSDGGLELRKFVVDDFYVYNSSNSITLDVLANDQFENTDDVEITETTDPENGDIVINPDNTLTYTPDDNTPEDADTPEDVNAPEDPDTFTYTTEVIEENGTVTTETGNVTIGTAENRAPISGANVYYVTVGGNSSNDGKSESTSWNVVHAFKTAKAGDVVHIKAGNYGAVNLSATNSGILGSPIRFFGYSNSPGDIIATNGSTFNYGNSVDAASMPLINAGATGTGVIVSGSYVEIHNFQIKDYGLGIDVRGNNSTLDNVISIDMGNQSSGGYDGFGIRLSGSDNTVKNSYIENATAEAFKVYGGTNNLVQFLEVRADNVTNPCDYYILLSNTSGNIVEDSKVERAGGLAHGGHGLTCKWKSRDNIFRRCETVYTNIEMNFEDVTGNLYEDIRMTGQGTSSGFWHTNIDFRNGANGNTVRNIYMTNVWSCVNFSEDNDGFQPSPDTDAVKCGYNNRIENLSIDNCDRVFQFVGYTNIGGTFEAPATGNVFDGLTVNGYNQIGSIYNTNSGNQIINATFKNHNGTTGISTSNGKPNNITWTASTFEGANHPSY